MKLDSSTSQGAEDGDMSANILLIEYEPRYIERAQQALEGSSYRLEIVGDLDAAVGCCATFEPQTVVITSVLPRIKIEDAITQLRARAGLRSTPFLILMSGYRGSDSAEDAGRYGAQDILARPFSSEAFIQKVEGLLADAEDPAKTQAIPSDMLQALRNGGGAGGSGPSLTSDDLFGDILSDVEGGGESSAPRPPKTEPKATTHEPSTKDAPKPPSAHKGGPSSGVDDALADVVKDGRTAPPIKRATVPTETDVDAILSQTLAGLDIQPMRRGKAKTRPPAAKEPAPVASPAEPPKTAPPKAKPVAKPKEAADKGKKAADGNRFGQYILQDHIATGGMAEVHKARMMGMEGFQKTVAIKRILSHLTENDEFVTMFIDEAKLAAQLNHNNIIHIYDLGKIERSYYIAMEYIEGRDLRSLIKDCRDRDVQLPIPISLHVTTLLAGALDYAHRKRDFDNRALGLVHRDVSPQNVLISGEGDIKLCDFGIAKAASKASHTRAGALKGKLQYMSPEQGWGKSIDHRSDIFSLGLVLYEMLTGNKLFSGDSELSILEQVRNPDIKPPSEINPDIPADVDKTVMRALEPEREKRYQSARDFQRDLEKVIKKHEWATDGAALALLMKELAGGKEITSASAAKTTKKKDTKTPPPKPPQSTQETPSQQPPDKAAAKAQTEPTEAPAAVVEAIAVDEPPPKKSNTLWLLIGAAALIVVAGGLYLLMGGDGPESPPSTTSGAAVAIVAETPTAAPGLMSDDELTEAAALAAAEIIEEKAEEMRERLEEEFPTPTPIPPTPTPAPTPTPEPTPEPVAVVPTATPAPPTPIPPTPTATPIPPTPTPSVRLGQLVQPGEAGVIAPAVISRVTPEYPTMARRVRAEGVVNLAILVGPDGAVEEIEVKDCSRPNVGFEKSAESAVRQWRFKPATKHGVKVRTWISVRVPFKMG